MEVEIILPVYNEEAKLERGVNALRQFLKENVAPPWRITIANNGSTDNTLNLAQTLCQRYPEVGLLHLDQKGRGRALRRAISQSNADVVVYMDIDLSTDLGALPSLLQAVAEGYDIATGSRLLSGAQVKRSLKREVLSRGYNFMVRALLQPGVKDAQCGFKAFRRIAVAPLLSQVHNQSWFFDTELLVIARRRSCKIKEIPVTWVEGTDSRVRILRTVTGNLRAMLDLRLRLWRGKGDGS
ncbi:MAG: dolichyl-phosphate beta-glucosyltransferase [Chloroflexota bacterium]